MLADTFGSYVAGIAATGVISLSSLNRRDQALISNEFAVPRLCDLGWSSAVLHRAEWAVACRIDGRATVGELAGHCGIPLRDAMDRVNHLIRRGLCVTAPAAAPSRDDGRGRADGRPQADARALMPRADGRPQADARALMPRADGRGRADGRPQADAPALLPRRVPETAPERAGAALAALRVRPDLGLLRKVLDGLNSLD